MREQPAVSFHPRTSAMISPPRSLTSKPKHRQSKDHQGSVHVLLSNSSRSKLHILGDKPRDSKESSREETNSDEEEGVGEEGVDGEDED